jgi:hypothetical protein
MRRLVPTAASGARRDDAAIAKPGTPIVDCRSVDTGDFFDGHLGIGQHLPASRRCA